MGKARQLMAGVDEPTARALLSKTLESSGLWEEVKFLNAGRGRELRDMQAKGLTDEYSRGQCELMAYMCMSPNWRRWPNIRGMAFDVSEMLYDKLIEDLCGGKQ